MGNGSNAAHAGIGQNMGLFGTGVLDLGLRFMYGKRITFGMPGGDDFSTGTQPFFAIQS
ncbi:hypothetical protein [Paraburkholderia rhizosphaerae]|uniref:hypothetical protein n=1 Tax=Paraburkholderia rhizosphaerae TaxID=480658 RepID=UPI001FB87596|nr:hypothetical protein [Paraburkholderia rhizosphaerae]